MNRRRSTRDQQGSLVVALAVVLVLTGLALAVLARTLGALNSSRQSQDAAAALAAANAGLSDALFALDQQSIDNPPLSPFPTAGPQAGSVASGATYQWRANQVNSDPNVYSVISIGAVNGVRRTVTEGVTRRPRYPYALFADNGVFFNGKSAAPYATSAPNGIYAETSGVRDAGAPPRTAAIASNHSIVLADGAGGGDAQVVLSPAGSCSGCLNPVGRTGPYRTPDPVVPSVTQTCPGVGGTVDGTVITAGTPYLCTTDLTLKGNVSVSASPGNPVVIYLASGKNLNLEGLTMSQLADPTGLVILKIGPGRVDGGTGGFAFTGILYAPGASLTSALCNLTVTGALTLGTFTCDGAGPAFTLAYDSRVEALRSDRWEVSGFHEIPIPASL